MWWSVGFLYIGICRVHCMPVFVEPNDQYNVDVEDLGASALINTMISTNDQYCP